MPVCSSCGAVFRGVSRVRDAANASCARRAWIGPRSFVGGSTLSHGTSHSPRRLARPSCSWWSRGREWRFGTETAELGSLHGPATGRASAQLVQALAAHPRARPARLSKGTTHGASGGQPGDLQRRYGPRSRCWVWILRTGLRQGRATESGSPERLQGAPSEVAKTKQLLARAPDQILDEVDASLGQSALCSFGKPEVLDVHVQSSRSLTETAELTVKKKKRTAANSRPRGREHAASCR